MAELARRPRGLSNGHRPAPIRASPVAWALPELARTLTGLTASVSLEPVGMLRSGSAAVTVRAGAYQLIYRVVGESTQWVWSEESGTVEVSYGPGRLMGAFNAGFAAEAWGDLPMPVLSNPRVRFWFTERGWRTYGLRVAAEARASGRVFRVLRRKNPPRSRVIYRDEWQVALLPDRD